jgi:hypothetical protein
MKRPILRDRAPLFPRRATGRELIYLFVVCESEYQGARERAALPYLLDDAMITVAARARDRHNNERTGGEKPRLES